MFSILDFPRITTLEKAREAIRFGGINLDEIVRYLKSGTSQDRLAQASYYVEMEKRARVRNWVEMGALALLVLAGIAFAAYKFLS